jgi:hypothetical protein
VNFDQAGGSPRAFGESRGTESERLLIAPISVTATKPLLPAHAKGLLWVDVVYRATRQVAEVDYHWNPRLPHLSGQTLHFWEYLDRTTGAGDYTDWSETDVGNAYVRFNAEGGSTSFDTIRPYAAKVEADGWVHPASRRLLQCWTEQFELLGVMDPGLDRDRPFLLSVEELLEILGGAGLLVDHRRYGGPAYLDGTRWGLPLRPGVSADGHANYVVMLLRDLLPVAGGYSGVLLVHDQEITPDYVLIERILEFFGGRVRRLPLGRVPMKGIVRSSRFGGWTGTTLRELVDDCRRDFPLDVCRLGMRLYFIAMLNRAGNESFSADLLHRALRQADRVLESAVTSEATPSLARYRDGRRTAQQDGPGWIDAYRLTVSLFSRREPPERVLLNAVYL